VRFTKVADVRSDGQSHRNVRPNSREILAEKDDDVSALKVNQPTLNEGIKAFFVRLIAI